MVQKIKMNLEEKIEEKIRLAVQKVTQIYQQQQQKFESSGLQSG